jgi:hypothetical protein
MKIFITLLENVNKSRTSANNLSLKKKQKKLGVQRKNLYQEMKESGQKNKAK